MSLPVPVQKTHKNDLNCKKKKTTKKIHRRRSEWTQMSVADRNQCSGSWGGKRWHVVSAETGQ